MMFNMKIWTVYIYISISNKKYYFQNSSSHCRPVKQGPIGRIGQKILSEEADTEEITGKGLKWN